MTEGPSEELPGRDAWLEGLRNVKMPQELAGALQDGAQRAFLALLEALADAVAGAAEQMQEQTDRQFATGRAETQEQLDKIRAHVAERIEALCETNKQLMEGLTRSADSLSGQVAELRQQTEERIAGHEKAFAERKAQSEEQLQECKNELAQVREAVEEAEKAFAERMAALCETNKQLVEQLTQSTDAFADEIAKLREETLDAFRSLPVAEA